MSDWLEKTNQFCIKDLHTLHRLQTVNSFISSLKVCSSVSLRYKIQHWALTLSAYSQDIQHWRGLITLNANTLSCLPFVLMCLKMCQLFFMTVSEQAKSLVNATDVRGGTSKDPLLLTVYHCIIHVSRPDKDCNIPIPHSLPDSTDSQSPTLVVHSWLWQL